MTTTSYSYGEDGTKNDEKGDEKDSETVVPPDEQTIQGLVDTIIDWKLPLDLFRS